MSLYKGSNKIMNGIENVPITSIINASSTNEQSAGAKAVYDIVPTDAHIKEISLLGENISDTTKYGSDLLYFPCGVYIFESNAIANNFTNAPVKQAGTFYVTSIVPNKNMNTDTYVYRNYRYETYYGVIYTRSLMTGSLSEGIRRDSGWNRVCTTKVADVSWTVLSNASFLSNGTIMYSVKNGICFVSIQDVSSSTMSTQSQTMTTGLPIPSKPNDWYGIFANNDSVSAPMQSLLVSVTEDGSLSTFKGTDNANYFGSFSYPVKES